MGKFTFLKGKVKCQQCDGYVDEFYDNLPKMQKPVNTTYILGHCHKCNSMYWLVTNRLSKGVTSVQKLNE